MILQKQKYFHKPAEGIVGDCFSTCVACVFNESNEHIPHFFGLHFDCNEPDKIVSPAVHASLNHWLKPRGLRYFEYPMECNREQLGIYLKHYLPNQYVLIGCNSKHGGHSVVMCNDNFMWDPSIDNSGCVGPMNDGYYWIGLFVKETSE